MSEYTILIAIRDALQGNKPSIETEIISAKFNGDEIIVDLMLDNNLTIKSRVTATLTLTKVESELVYS